MSAAWLCDQLEKSKQKRYQDMHTTHVCRHSAPIVEGRCHGHGMWTDPITKNTYSGDWAHGLLIGDATIGYRTGGTYKGTLNERLQRHGFGRQIYPGGSSYEGQWRDDQRYGVGLFTDAMCTETKATWDRDIMLFLLSDV